MVKLRSRKPAIRLLHLIHGQLFIATDGKTTVN
jgi:hypothetical protein